MKTLFLLAGVVALLTAVGCQAHRGQSHQGGAYGGTDEGAQSSQGQGSGEFLGYPNYPEYRDY